MQQIQSSLLNRATPGSEVDGVLLEKQVNYQLAKARFTPITIVATPVDPSIDEALVQELLGRGEKMLGNIVRLNFEYQSFVISEANLSLISIS